MKQLISNYIFDSSAGTITLPDFDTVELERLMLITDVTNGAMLFNFADSSLGATVSGNVITLETDTSDPWFDDTDSLAIRYETQYGDPYYGGPQVISGTRSAFRDGFSSTDVSGLPKPEVWDYQNPGGHIVTYGGNSNASSYLRISLDPFTDSNEVTLTSKEYFEMPMRVGFGLSLSQRIIGQEVFVGMVGANDNGVVETITPDADKALSATISVTSNVGTVTLANHGFVGGDRISIYGCAEHRLNVGPVVVTVLDKNTFTIPITLANGSHITTGGFVRHADPLRAAKNGFGLLFENATATNGSLVTRRNGEKYRSVNKTVSTTAASQSNTNSFTDAFNAASIQELFLAMDECSYRSYGTDSTTGISGIDKFSQGIPDEDKKYKIHVRARNLSGMTKPVARVTSAVKSASATATITTDVAHGLVAGDYVQVYGIADVTNFPVLGAQTVVASVPTSTTFTIVIGSSATATSSGGTVFKNEGSVLAPGVFAQTIVSVSRTNGVLSVVGSGTWATPVAGEYVQVHGMMAGAATYEGAYKVLRVNTTTLDLEAPGPDFGSITTGGTVFRRTDVRLHFIRLMDYTRTVVEVQGGRGNVNDQNNAVPVAIGSSTTIAVNASPQATASATGATTRHRLVAAATTNATSVKTTAGRVYEVHAFNASGALKYLKFYNKASAPTVGTDPVVELYPLAAGALTRIAFEDRGNYFSTGIAYAITGAMADADTTALAANDVVVNMHYV